MKPDLIFHAVSKRKWREMNRGGYYRIPDEDAGEENKPIICVASEQLGEYLNNHYKGRKNLLLLVIDTSRVVCRIDNDKAENRWIVHDGVNADAILDKIRLNCNEEGLFELEVHRS